jgi:hypothetical protein
MISYVYSSRVGGRDRPWEKRQFGNSVAKIPWIFFMSKQVREKVPQILFLRGGVLWPHILLLRTLTPCIYYTLTNSNELFVWDLASSLRPNGLSTLEQIAMVLNRGRNSVAENIKSFCNGFYRDRSIISMIVRYA